MFEQVKTAKIKIKNYANVTPVMTSRTLNNKIGAHVYFKCENFQRVGAFKFRGAFNSISRLSDAERKRGILTFSSGNHAQAVALVGKMLNVPTTVVMPQNAPASKLAATEGYGATVVKYDPDKTRREEIAAGLERNNGYTMIHPFDNRDVIAGQGTAALGLFVGPQKKCA